MKKAIKFTKFSNNLCSKALAEKLRSQIEEMLENNDNKKEKITFDFKNVICITSSFADECFAKLVKKYSINVIKNKTTFKNTNPFLQMIIAKSANQRNERPLLKK